MNWLRQMAERHVTKALALALGAVGVSLFANGEPASVAVSVEIPVEYGQSAARTRWWTGPGVSVESNGWRWRSRWAEELQLHTDGVTTKGRAIDIGLGLLEVCGASEGRVRCQLDARFEAGVVGETFPPLRSTLELRLGGVAQSEVNGSWRYTENNDGAVNEIGGGYLRYLPWNGAIRAGVLNARGAVEAAA